MSILFSYTDFVMSLLCCSCGLEGEAFGFRFIRNLGRPSTADTVARTSIKGVC